MMFEELPVDHQDVYTANKMTIERDGGKTDDMTVISWSKWRYRLTSKTKISWSLHPLDQFGHAWLAVLIFEVRPNKFVEAPDWVYLLAGFRKKRLVNPPVQYRNGSRNDLAEWISKQVDGAVYQISGCDERYRTAVSNMIDSNEAYKIWGALLNEWQ